MTTRGFWSKGSVSSDSAAYLNIHFGSEPYTA